MGRQGLEPWTYGLKARIRHPRGCLPNSLIINRNLGYSESFCDTGGTLRTRRDDTWRDSKCHSLR